MNDDNIEQIYIKTSLKTIATLKYLPRKMMILQYLN